MTLSPGKATLSLKAFKKRIHSASLWMKDLWGMYRDFKWEVHLENHFNKESNKNSNTVAPPSVPSSDDSSPRCSLKTISLCISSLTFFAEYPNSHEWIYCTMNSNLLIVSMTAPTIYVRRIFFLKGRKTFIAIECMCTAIAVYLHGCSCIITHYCY